MKILSECRRYIRRYPVAQHTEVIEKLVDEIDECNGSKKLTEDAIIRAKTRAAEYTSFAPNHFKDFVAWIDEARANQLITYDYKSEIIDLEKHKNTWFWSQPNPDIAREEKFKKNTTSCFLSPAAKSTSTSPEIPFNVIVKIVVGT